MKLKRKISLLLAMCMSTACAAGTAVFADEEGAPEPAATVIDLGQNMQFDALKITYSGAAPTEDTAIKVGRKNYTVKANEQTQYVNVADNTVADTITFPGYDKDDVTVELLKYRKLTGPAVKDEDNGNYDITYRKGSEGISVNRAIMTAGGTSKSAIQAQEESRKAGYADTWQLFDGTYENGLVTNTAKDYTLYARQNHADDFKDASYNEYFDNADGEVTARTLKSDYEIVNLMTIPLKEEYEIAKIMMYQKNDDEASYTVTTYSESDVSLENGDSETEISYTAMHDAPKIAAENDNVRSHYISQYINKPAKTIEILFSDIKKGTTGGTMSIAELAIYTYEHVYTLDSGEAMPEPASVPNYQRGVAVNFLDNSAGENTADTAMESTDNGLTMFKPTQDWAYNVGGTDENGITYRSIENNNGKDNSRLSMIYSAAVADYIAAPLTIVDADNKDSNPLPETIDATLRVKYYDDEERTDETPYIYYQNPESRQKDSTHFEMTGSNTWKWHEVYVKDLSREALQQDGSVWKYRTADGNANLVISNNKHTLKVAEFMILFGDQRTLHAAVDYANNRLTGLVPGEYEVTYEGQAAPDKITVSSTKSTAPINEDWVGKTISLKKVNIIDLSSLSNYEDGTMYETEAQELEIAEQGAAPAEGTDYTIIQPTETGAKGAVTETVEGTLEYSSDGSSWGDIPSEIEQGTIFYLRFKAADGKPASASTATLKINAITEELYLLDGVTDFTIGKASSTDGVLLQAEAVGDGQVPALSAYIVTYTDGNLLANVSKIDFANNQAVIPAQTGEAYKIFIWTDKYVPVIAPITSATTGNNQLF